jgi:uncharacterized protein (DUF697 family)
VTGLRTAIDLLREMDLRKVQEEASAPARVMIVGDGEHARAVGLWLSGGAAVATHPRLQMVSAAADVRMPSSAERVVALLVAPATAPRADLAAWALRLRSAGLPVVALEVDESAPTAVGSLDGAPYVPLIRLPARQAAAQFQALVVPAILDAARSAHGAELALARHLPALRREYARRLVEETARTNAWYALSTGVAQVAGVLNLPIAMADVVVLTKNQLMMAYKIALAAGKEDRPHALMVEIIGVVGAGLLFRQIARELVGMMPVVGLVPKVAVAYAGTRVVGVAAESWALEGRRIETNELRRLFADALAQGRRVGRQMVDRLPEGEPDPRPDPRGNPPAPLDDGGGSAD